MPRKRLPSPKPFHPVARRHNGRLLTYDIYVINNPFLNGNNPLPLRRHEAYAICRLLNSETRSLKWAQKFSDPYVD